MDKRAFEANRNKLPIQSDAGLLAGERRMHAPLWPRRWEESYTHCYMNCTWICTTTLSQYYKEQIMMEENLFGSHRILKVGQVPIHHWLMPKYLGRKKNQSSCVCVFFNNSQQHHTGWNRRLEVAVQKVTVPGSKSSHCYRITSNHLIHVNC